MSVYVNNITIDSGVEFSLPLTILDNVGSSALNLTGYACSAMMRKHSKSSAATTFNVGITSAAEGKIALGLASTITSALKEGRYVYDILLTTPTNMKSIVVEGMVLVRVGITS
tara:strand:+ start:103 stop:441 length:339 start_codon:yes stop_codon:yes gene_type:complete